MKEEARHGPVEATLAKGQALRKTDYRSLYVALASADDEMTELAIERDHFQCYAPAARRSL